MTKARDWEFKWVTSPDEIINVFDADADDIRQALDALAKSYAGHIEDWMKKNRKWKDHTGNLRQSLFAEVRDLTDIIAIVIGYGVEYGDYVNYLHQGRYAIIEPALDLWGPRLLEDAQGVIGK